LIIYINNNMIKKAHDRMTAGDKYVNVL